MFVPASIEFVCEWRDGRESRDEARRCNTEFDERQVVAAMNFQQCRTSTTPICHIALAWLRYRFEDLLNETESAGSFDHAEYPATSESGETLPALELLAIRLGLSKFEIEVLFLCAAMEFDPGTATRCAMAAGNAAQHFLHLR